jgi:hypothetical protein
MKMQERLEMDRMMRNPIPEERCGRKTPWCDHPRSAHRDDPLLGCMFPDPGHGAICPCHEYIDLW